MIGGANRPPSLPSEVMVKDEPPRSSFWLLPSRAARATRSISLRDLEDAQAIAAAHDRHHQAGVGRGGDADVVGLAQHELHRGFVECELRRGWRFSAATTALTRNGRNVSFTPAFSAYGLARSFRVGDRGHVDFVDVVEVRGGVLRPRHVLEDALAQAADRDALVAGLTRGRRRRARQALWRRVPRWPRWRRARQRRSRCARRLHG